MFIYVTNGQTGLSFYVENEDTAEVLQERINIQILKDGVHLLNKPATGAYKVKVSKPINAKYLRMFTVGTSYVPRRFGKTKFELVKHANGFSIDFSKPVGEYGPVRYFASGSQRPEVETETPSVDTIQAAVTTINQLDRELFRVSVNTETNKITVTLKTEFS